MNHTTHQPAFGRRLRQLRLQRGMSQAELARDEVSASYISLVECGRRPCNEAMAALFAKRLEVSLEALTAAEGPEQHRSRRLDLTGRLLTARALRRDGDLDTAVERLRLLAHEPVGPAEEDVAWEAAWELSEVQETLGRLAEQHIVLDRLADVPLTQESARLSVRVSTALSRNRRRRGRPGEAVRAGERAVTAAAGLPQAEHERVAAHLELLLGYGESGELDNAERLAASLEKIVEDVPSRQLRGLVQSGLSSTCFLLGRVPDGVRWHERSLTCLRPEADLSAWARVCLASAVRRMDHDPSPAAPDAAAALLARARQALELIGSPRDLRDLAVGEAQLALCRREPDSALGLLEPLVAETAPEPSADEGVCLLLAARAHRMAGDPPRAQERYREAARTLDDMGAYRRSAQAWRELSDMLAADRPDGA
ncbi:XRE family transcriptional regulator [Streptomyces sp. RKND-216]|uniref:helix-turn-helix domain-containing protein n=1 Tax=Streptomyces sp. RKND-216 TaxID=2562581 RepID=UPI00109E028F|nr:helix-turn-helix transcriptional regulator [Streptomyces sp. RKND-216]THA25968.1 XRE family transcriptional regulator [Streptomyces sp. RKND-216]